MDQGDTAYTLGRFQGYGNHHDAALRLLVDQVDKDIDTLYVGVLRTPPGSRSYQNPFTHDEVTTMIEEAYQEDYDPPFGVDTFVFGDNPLDHRRQMASLAGRETTFLTRQKQWKMVADSLYLLEQVAPVETRDIDAFYRPRTHDHIEAVAASTGYEVAPCSGAIRERIAEGDGEWRRYVSSSVADLIDDDFDAARSAITERLEGDKFNIRGRVNEYIRQALPGRRGHPDEDVS